MSGRVTPDESRRLLGKGPVVQGVLGHWVLLGLVAALVVLVHYC